MKTITFHADDGEVRLIRDEQLRLAALGGRASESEAIRTFIARAAGNGAAPAANGAKEPKFRVLPGGKMLYQRVEKYFFD